MHNICTYIHGSTAPHPPLPRCVSNSTECCVCVQCAFYLHTYLVLSRVRRHTTPHCTQHSTAVTASNFCAAPHLSFINLDSTWNQSTVNNQSINYSHKSFMFLLKNTAWWPLREHESVLPLRDSIVLLTDFCLPSPPPPPSAWPRKVRAVMLTTGKWYLSTPWGVAQCASGCNDA
jgi:hypothetical protein